MPNNNRLLFSQRRQQIPPEKPKESGLANRLLEGCFFLFSNIIHHAKSEGSLSEDVIFDLRESYKVLRLWADGFHARDGELDKTLEESRDLGRTTLSMLLSLVKTLLTLNQPFRVAKQQRESWSKTDVPPLLEEIKSHLQSEDFSDKDSTDSEYSETSSQHSNADALDDGMKDLKTYIQCLVDLAPSIESPARYVEDVGISYHSGLIAASYPQATPGLINRLAKVNWDRDRRIGSLISLVGAPDFHVRTDPDFENVSVVSVVPRQFPPAHAMSYALRHIDKSSPQIPPLAEAAKRGQPFVCRFCGKLVTMTSEQQWRKHVLLDLQPYTCYYDHCAHNRVSFRECDQWIHHLGVVHHLGPEWLSQKCPLCANVISAGREALITHLGGHMEDIALAALPGEVNLATAPDANPNARSVEIWGKTELDTGEDKAGLKNEKRTSEFKKRPMDWVL